uniref:Galectin n=1 Tax=Globodera pallida TaxID=36090 RepID=A0A183CE95_GLOPA
MCGGARSFNIPLLTILLAFCHCDERVIGGEEPEEKLPYKQYVSEQKYQLPFKTRISEPFKEGQTVHAVGKAKMYPKRVDINFHRGGNDWDDMPLHLSTRWDEGIFSGNVVFNTYTRRNWSEPEERVPSPFLANDEFDIRIRILPGKFQINHVSIIGDLESLRLFHYGGTSFPNPYSAIAKLIPYKRLDVSALPTGNRVNVNLYKRNNQDIALQVSIRYSEGAIVRNTMNASSWGDEERDGGFPLAKGEIFDLTIVHEPAHFQIILNGKKFCTFKHRLPNYMDIETLEVDGTVELHTVTINDAR